MKKLIRRIINWVYGVDIGLALIILWEAKNNLSIMMRDHMLREAIKGGPGIKEEEL